MIHALLIGAAIYLGGAILTAALMAFGSARDPEPADRYDLAVMGCGAMLWPATLPFVLSTLVGMRGADGEGEGGER